MKNILKKKEVKVVSKIGVEIYGNMIVEIDDDADIETEALRSKMKGLKSIAWQFPDGSQVGDEIIEQIDFNDIVIEENDDE